MSDGWLDCGSYILNTAEQGSKEWLEARKKCVVTASRFHDVYRHIRFFVDPPDNSPIIPNEAMRFGTMMEPKIRDWFSSTYKLAIIEAGLAIPKWCPHIGSSVDGIILKDGKPDGIIEIKTTVRHKPELISRLGTPKDYISPWHYAQMQGGMAILDLPYCYYISYSRETKLIHIVNVKRDSNYWSNELYPSLLQYINRVHCEKK